METTRLEFEVVFDEDESDDEKRQYVESVEAFMNKMQWKTAEEEMTLLKRIVEVDLGGVFTVVNENKVKADFRWDLGGVD